MLILEPPLSGWEVNGRSQASAPPPTLVDVAAEVAARARKAEEDAARKAEEEEEAARAAARAKAAEEAAERQRKAAKESQWKADNDRRLEEERRRAEAAAKAAELAVEAVCGPGTVPSEAMALECAYPEDSALPQWAQGQGTDKGVLSCRCDLPPSPAFSLLLPPSPAISRHLPAYRVLSCRCAAPHLCARSALLPSALLPSASYLTLCSSACHSSQPPCSRLSPTRSPHARCVHAPVCVHVVHVQAGY